MKYMRPVYLGGGGMGGPVCGDKTKDFADRGILRNVREDKEEEDLLVLDQSHVPPLSTSITELI